LLLKRRKDRIIHLFKASFY